MIGFFIKSEGAGAEFRPYVRGNQGLGRCLDKLFTERTYGSDVKIFLIMFYIEGSPTMWLPKKLRPSYTTKEKALSVEVPVLKEFFAKNERERCQFVVENVVASLHSVRKLCERNQLDLDLDALVRDVEGAGKRWIEARQSPAATN